MQRKPTTFIIIIFFLIAYQQSFSKENVTLEKLYNPMYLSVSCDYIYVAEKYSVHIYGKRDFKHINSFGRKGEGPGEFLLVMDLTSGDDWVAVSDAGKIQIFSSKGKFIKSLKSSPTALRFTPIGNKFLGWGPLTIDGVGYFVISFYDENLKKEEEVYRYTRPGQGSSKFNILSSDVEFRVSGDRVFINGKDDLIHCYDGNGKEINTLSLDIERLKVSPEFKADYINSMKSNEKTSMIYEMYKSSLEFPEYFPLISYFRVSDNKIYVLSLRQKAESYLCNVLDFSGKILKKALVQFHFKDIQNAYPFDINDGILYQAIEDEDDGPAHLRITEIK